MDPEACKSGEQKWTKRKKWNAWLKENVEWLKQGKLMGTFMEQNFGSVLVLVWVLGIGQRVGCCRRTAAFSRWAGSRNATLVESETLT